jgi:two-component system NtrC family response regulator
MCANCARRWNARRRWHRASDHQDLAFATGASEPVHTQPQPRTLEEEVAALERRRIMEALNAPATITPIPRELGLSRVGLLKKMDRMGLR